MDSLIRCTFMRLLGRLSLLRWHHTDPLKWLFFVDWMYKKHPFEDSDRQAHSVSFLCRIWFNSINKCFGGRIRSFGDSRHSSVRRLFDHLRNILVTFDPIKFWREVCWVVAWSSLHSSVSPNFSHSTSVMLLLWQFSRKGRNVCKCDRTEEAPVIYVDRLDPGHRTVEISHAILSTFFQLDSNVHL